MVNEIDLKNMLYAAANPNTPPEMLEELAGADQLLVRQEVAWNASTPPKALEQLAGDKNIMVRLTVADNPGTPPGVLEQLAGDEDWRVRREVAWNANKPPKVLEQLAEDEDSIVRRAVGEENWYQRTVAQIDRPSKTELERLEVANNPDTPQGVLEELAGDEDWRIREAVAWNINTPSWVLEKLAGNDIPDIRRGVAWNENTPPEALEQLVYFSAGFEIYGGAFGSASECQVRLAIALNKNTPPKALEQLARDKEWEVRVAVASNPNTPREVLNKLVEDKEWEVRAAVASNLNMPPEVLEKLVGVRVARDMEKESIFSIKIYGFEKWFKNESGLSADGLCRVYAECQKPYVDMERYGKPIDIGKFALIQQSDNLSFSVAFDVDQDEIIIFNGKDITDIPLKETIHKISAENLEKPTHRLDDMQESYHVGVGLFKENFMIKEKELAAFINLSAAEEYIKTRIDNDLFSSQKVFYIDARVQNGRSALTVKRYIYDNKQEKLIEGNEVLAGESDIYITGYEVSADFMDEEGNYDYTESAICLSAASANKKKIEYLQEGADEVSIDELDDIGIKKYFWGSDNFFMGNMINGEIRPNFHVEEYETSSPAQKDEELLEVPINQSQIMRVTEKTVAICISEEDGIKQYIEVSRDRLTFHNNKYFIDMPAGSKLFDTMKAPKSELTPENDMHSKRSGVATDATALKPKAR